MKDAVQGANYFFVDESGDPTFYSRISETVRLRLPRFARNDIRRPLMSLRGVWRRSNLPRHSRETCEMRYCEFVEDNVSLLVDRYDHAKYPKNWYNRDNPFDIKKASPL